MGVYHLMIQVKAWLSPWMNQEELAKVEVGQKIPERDQGRDAGQTETSRDDTKTDFGAHKTDFGQKTNGMN